MILQQTIIDCHVVGNPNGRYTIMIETKMLQLCLSIQNSVPSSSCILIILFPLVTSILMLSRALEHK